MIEETPRQRLFAFCWRGEEGSLDKVGRSKHSAPPPQAGVYILPNLPGEDGSVDKGGGALEKAGRGIHSAPCPTSLGRIGL